MQVKKTVNNELISSASSSSVVVLRNSRRPARATQVPTKASAVAAPSIAYAACKKNVWVKFNGEVIGGPIVCRIPTSRISKKADDVPAIEPKRGQKRIHSQTGLSSSQVKRCKGQSSTLMNINQSSKPNK
ncbi:hypothetical protein O6H91_05G011700 [Diphasiastrum complanatum]|uniref:Uncharacterized protein n=1 Tax=Diphasiastrum complanatum TaxID=34168 RepID=A0ACC2DL88_DIPCM|nr:hypothetical protein O6H91_05G011700 [Diphasiastrum complanatum]